MPARIFVLAGVNGAGKSSVGGAALLQKKVADFNPDLAARALLDANPGLSVEAANGQDWEFGRKGMERAQAKRLNFAFTLTLGARTITQMLLEGARQGARIHLWYAGLTSPQRHLQRAQARVAAGGHDIPEAKIRERYETSRTNRSRLLPHLGLPSRTNTCRPWSAPSCGSTSARQRSMQAMATHGEWALRCCVACSTSEVQPVCLDQGGP
jgi:predicted ABC-type ATPase